MNTTAPRQTRLMMWACIILLPPLGLGLLWIKRCYGFWARAFLSLAAIALGMLHLYLFWGLRLEFDGSLKQPFIAFRNPERHYAHIDKQRKEDASVDTSLTTASRQEPVAPPSSVSKVKTESPAAESTDYWTEFRGPGRKGIYEEAAILTDWPSGKLPLLWKRPVGGGYASVVVGMRTAFTIEQRREREVVAAYDLISGREKWIHGWEAEFRETLGGDGPRATPTFHKGLLYALGAEGELRCLDAGTGSCLWSCNILKDNNSDNLQWGMAGSPLVVDDMVIVLPGGSGGKSVVAYNRLTGKAIWKAMDDRQAYTSPQIVNLCGRRQVLVVSASRVMGLEPRDGSLLWEYPWVTSNGINVAQPIATADNRIFLSAGYSHGAALLEVSVDGDSWKAQAVWQNPRMKNKFASSVLSGGHIYGLDESVLACIDAATGELKWKGGRYGFGQLLLASGHLIIASEEGEIALVKADPEGHKERARFAALEGKTWNVPAIAEGNLIVRNQTEMACYRIAK